MRDLSILVVADAEPRVAKERILDPGVSPAYLERADESVVVLVVPVGNHLKIEQLGLRERGEGRPEHAVQVIALFIRRCKAAGDHSVVGQPPPRVLIFVAEYADPADELRIGSASRPLAAC